MIIMPPVNKPCFVNPKQIIELELVKGKRTAFVTGKEVDDKLEVSSIDVREPWTVIVHTAVKKHYINCKDFETALERLVTLSEEISPIGDVEKYKATVRGLYGKKQNS